VPPHARVVPVSLPFFWFLMGVGWHGHATTGTGRASLSGQGGQNFSLFFNRIRTKTYKKMKIIQNIQKQSN